VALCFAFSEQTSSLAIDLAKQIIPLLHGRIDLAHVNWQGNYVATKPMKVTAYFSASMTILQP